MTPPRHILLLALAFHALPAAVWGQSNYFEARTGAWEQDDNWSRKEVPDMGSQVVIGGGKSASVSTQVSPISTFYLGGNGKGVGKLTILPGARLQTMGGAHAHRNLDNTEGHLHLQGGELIMSTGTAASLYLGTSSTSATKSIATFSGGTFYGSLRIGADEPEKGTGILTIEGSKCTVRPSTQSNTIQVRTNGTLVFKLDAQGPSPIVFDKQVVQFSKGSTLVIEAGQYKGISDSFTLIKARRLEDNGAVVEYRGFEELQKPKVRFSTKTGEVILHIGK